MLRRACVILLGALGLAACQGSPFGTTGYAPTPMTGPTTGARGGAGSVAILLPLSGPLANVGEPMLRAARLALPQNGAPTLAVKDTGGSPDSAAAAARDAIARGATLILGPLTAAETAAVAPVAREARVPVLAFTNASNQAQPGVWTLGITPAQQVRRLVVAAQAQGKSAFAGLLPDSDFGRSLGAALEDACATAGLPPPTIRYHGSGMNAITAATRDISGYASRRGPLDARIRAARAEGTAEGRRQAADLARNSVPPPPFDTLLLGAVGEDLQLLASMLPYFDVEAPAVQFLGPTLWASAGSRAGVMNRAWFAAPDSASRTPLEVAYTDKYGTPPPPLADLAFDAASIARVLAGRGGYSVSALTQPGGFGGVDGWLVLMSDGQVRRGLAVYQIGRGGPVMVEPAPASAEVPGS